MAMYYDKVHKVPVWVIVDLPEKRAQAVIDLMVAECACYFQPWPAKSFPDTIKEMARNGWAHVVNQPKPYKMDIQFVGVAVNRHVKNCFGANTVMPGSHDKPYQHALDRNVASEADYPRIFNAVLALEQDISLSQIFGMGEAKSQVYMSDASSNRELIYKLAAKTLTVSDVDANINVKGKKVEEICDLISREVQKFLP